MPTGKWIDLLKRTRPDLWLKRVKEEKERVNALKQRDAAWAAKTGLDTLQNVQRAATELLTFAAYVSAIWRKFKLAGVESGELQQLKRDVERDGRALRDAVVNEMRHPGRSSIDVRLALVALTRVINDY